MDVNKESSSQDQGRENWEIQDQFLVGWLRGTIVKEVIGHFLGNDPTHRTTIVNRYVAPSLNRMLHYHRLLQNMKKHGLIVDDIFLR